MKNVELVPVVCPQCGSSMDIPEKLDKVHCMYCGTKFIVSEKQPDVHYHYHGEKKSIENYLRLAMRYIQEGKIQKSIGYFDKAREVDMERADHMITRNSRNFAKLYLAAARKEIDELAKRGKVQIYPNPDDDPIGRMFIEDDELDRHYYASEISRSRAEREIKDLTFEARLALEEAEKYITGEMIDLRGALYHIRGDFHLRIKNLVVGDFALIAAQDRLARKYYKKAVRIDNNDSDAIQKLVKLGEGCTRCWGVGDCPHCHRSRTCYNCKGSGGCKWCKGDGKIGLFGKQIKCIRCGGSGHCHTCEGNGRCHICHGTGNCPDCDGLRVRLDDE